ncbi:MAG: aldehyde dehydrogenase family protein, partial [Pseudomonadota bacterium]
MTSSYLEFWLPAGARGATLKVAGPGGTAEAVPLAVDVPQALEGDGQVIAQASLDTREGGAQRIFIALAPTDAGQSGRRPAPSGVWQVSVSATLPGGGRIDAHVLRDGAPEQLGRDGQFLGQHICTPLLGTALHINAFNFPVWGMLEKLAPTWLAGMPAIVKPATATCQITEACVRIMLESGLVPDGALQLIA